MMNENKVVDIMRQHFNDCLIEQRVWERIVAIEENIKNLQSVDEKNQSLEEQVRKNDTTIHEQKEEINRFHSLVSELKQDKAAMKEQAEQLEKDKQCLEIKISDLESDKKELKIQAEQLEETKQEQETRISDLESNKKDLEIQTEQLEETKQDLETKISDLESDKKNLKTEISSLESDKKEWKGKAEKLEITKQDLETRISDLEQDKKDLENKLSGIEQDKKDLEKQIEKLETDKKVFFENWETFIKPYKEIMLLMYQCSGLQTIIKQFGMDVSKKGEDFQSIIRFVNLLGNQDTFAPVLYSFYEIINQDPGNRKALDEDDYCFMKALNDYYRKTYGMNYNKFYYPEQDNTKFDKERMKDIDSPTKTCRSFSEVYVPAVMRGEEHVEKMMRVKGE